MNNKCKKSLSGKHHFIKEKDLYSNGECAGVEMYKKPICEYCGVVNDLEPTHAQPKQTETI